MTGRPVVLVPHGYRSIPPLQLAAAATDVCDLVWLVRGSDPELASVGRLLGRLGPVVDIDGLGADQTATALSQYHPGAVVAFRDQDLVPMAALAERLGLDFHAPIVAQRLADKVDQRQALRAGGVPVPSWWELPSRRDRVAVAAVAAEVTYPAVVKPRQGSGSWHTFPVADATDLVTVLAGLDDTDEAMMVEQYLPSAAGADRQRFADYVSVETLGTSTGLRHVAVTGRLHPVPPFRETGFFVPSDLGPDDMESVLASATDSLAALGVRSGCVHTEIKLTPDGPRVIEVNGRLGGGIRDMVSAAAGVDLLALYLRCSLGQPVELGGPARCDAVGYRLFYHPPVSARRVRSIGGLGKVGLLPGVDEVSLHLSPGDPIDAAQGSRSFVFSVVGSADDPAGVAETNRRMYELADVTYDHVTSEHGTDEHGSYDHVTDDRIVDPARATA